MLPKVAKQIGTPRPPDPILRRPRTDRDEKRVTHGRDRADIQVISTKNALYPTTQIREDSYNMKDGAAVLSASSFISFANPCRRAPV